MIRDPLSAFSEVVDTRRKWNADWYVWLSEIAKEVKSLRTGVDALRTDVDAILSPPVLTWTPVLTFVTPTGLSITYTTQLGFYSKIGKFVVARISLATATFSHASSGDLRITGLPFASANDAGVAWRVGNLQWSGITKANYTDVVLLVLPGVTEMSLGISGSGQPTSTVGAGDVPSGGNVIIRGTFFYFTA